MMEPYIWETLIENKYFFSCGWIKKMVQIFKFHLVLMYEEYFKNKTDSLF